ncbi:hypothetical protein KUTeg_011283 [Tegillarca granosa]|uniref:Poly [ADP-ribose] polymerase n=1 Tax=Tegillarca granosa TaxID=220873 RepID=A0ABQ9F194_TEGGR|nr:hypothetical protein KUTeg_011283 [Tegillarca granosa]
MWQDGMKNHRGKTASRNKKETTREQETEESDEVLQRGRKGQNGNKSSHAGSIIQSEDVDICRNNIRERCKYGENCNRHHCNLPYHWQYKVPTQPWKSFPLVVNETLEMNFCDKDIDNAIVSVGNDRCVVDFNQMKGKVKDGELTLHRLSTSSACEAPPGETLVTNWTWYWKHENDGFLKYTNSSLQQQSGDLPNHWVNMNDEEEEMKRVLIQRSEKEYMDVFKVFVSSLVVVWIDVLNRKKLRMEKQNKADGVNELQLFHGTCAENVDPISRTNFDWRLYGSAVGSIYGKGSYFAADAKYPDSGYAQKDKALNGSGKFTAGESDLRRPPPIDPASSKGRLYDSTVDNPNSPRIYCIFDNSQYYPENKIWCNYKELFCAPII